MLNSGIDLIKAVEVVARKSGNAACRRHLSEVAETLRRGEDFTHALKAQDGYFPPLFVDMVHVAETTGNMPEVLREMAEHYEKNISLRNEFMGWLAWPLIELFAAIFIVALMILLIGWFTGNNTETFDPLGFGLLGTEGALTWLGYCFGTIFGLVFLYFLAVRGLGQQSAVHRLLLSIPALGPCLRSFATARFSWGFYLTQDAGMPIAPSIDASLKATGNGAYASTAPSVNAALMEGEELARALDETGLFTDEYIHIVQVAETSGTVPEELHRLSPELEADARRSMRKMAVTASIGVWMMVAGLIIFLIFRIFMWYTGLINDALQGI